MLGFLLGFVAVVLGGIILFQTFERAPRLGPVRPRSRVEPAQRGPVAELAAVARSTGVQRFRLAIEQEARAQLFAYTRARALPPTALPPILARLMDRGGEEEWAREEALWSYRGPRWLFPIWALFAELTQSRDARTIRYLDALTRALRETVEP